MMTHSIPKISTPNLRQVMLTGDVTESSLKLKRDESSIVNMSNHLYQEAIRCFVVARQETASGFFIL